MKCSSCQKKVERWLRREYNVYCMPCYKQALDLRQGLSTNDNEEWNNRRCPGLQLEAVSHMPRPLTNHVVRNTHADAETSSSRPTRSLRRVTIFRPQKSFGAASHAAIALAKKGVAGQQA